MRQFRVAFNETVTRTLNEEGGRLMRLAIFALSAVAMTGCSWLGGSGHHKMSAADCVPVGPSGYGYTQAGYGYAGAGCVDGMYGVGHGGVYGSQTYGQTGYAQAGYGAAYGQNAYGQAGYGAAYGAQGFGAAGQAGYGAAGMQATTLGSAAPYGAAIGNPYGQNVVGTQYSNGQYVQGAGVQTVMGAPVYVPQPYGVPQMRGYGSGADCCGGTSVAGAMPLGIEVFGGTEFDISGDIFTKKSDGPPDGDYTQNIRVGEINAIGYDDAFGEAVTVGGSLAYDVSPNTTLLGTISYSEADGQTVENYTTVEPGTWAANAAGGYDFTSTGAARSLDGTFSDLNLTTLEGGIRQYVGHNPGFRPYVGATAGFVHNNDVEFVQTYNDDGSVYGQRQFAESGWNPTASAVLGAEMAVSPRAAIGIESGIRWRDSFDTAAPADDRISIPLTLRGRLAF